MFATKLFLLLMGVALYLAFTGAWFLWLAPELILIGSVQTLVGAFAGCITWLCLTFSTIVHIIKTARP
ncbi:hypothetical protein QIT80_gp03 (endogenous virus) [Pseudomonas phage phiAH14a]|uniref:Uncharacterized protein n=1 Tax=Pseudomonas phage phiAH14a TaxID=1805958 RepID=A0A1B0VM58_9CAUD|nr:MULTISPECIES: hypothetical protein [unclassified Pseudomonas]YP_010773020.1 hypothetical protein QIT80_gp03 [Pseudomonas phage phiAH14a]AMW64463.1 hypothetical protein AH14a_p03 [Pseudomonas phage phiAH14a]KAA0946704.1 hypothetical protein FQ182_13345 [Pseudomonas sp. ANT_H4]KAA0953195.1 hypothetical protein FQ186_06520 [Pseudomonas sp. ANT_H14]